MENTNAFTKPEPPAILRWTVLIVVSLAMFGNYYLYDCISPLADLLASQLKFTDSNIGLLQGIYSAPNVVMVLVGGFIIDRIGTKKAALIFSTLCMIGAVVTALSGDITFMVVGRLIFGLGAESLIVAVTTTMAKWFRGKELSFAFGINLTIARLGSFAALNSPSWGKAFFDSWNKPLWVAAIFGMVSVISVIIYYFLDSSAVKKYALQQEEEQEKIKFSSIFHISNNRYLIAIALVAIEIFLTGLMGLDLLERIVFAVSFVILSFLNYKEYSRSFWLIVLLCVTFYSAMFPFQTFAVKFFMDHHGVSRGTGGFLSSLLTVFAMVLTPLFGLLSDKIGRRGTMMMIGSLLIIPVYLLMAYTGLTLYIPMAMMGIAFSLVPAVMWPSVALIVDQSKLGTAYGLMTMIQNIGLTAFNFIIGWSNDFTHDYYFGMWIFSSLGFFGMAFAFLLKRQESKEGSHGLEYPKVETT